MTLIDLQYFYFAINLRQFLLDSESLARLSDEGIDD